MNNITFIQLLVIVRFGVLIIHHIQDGPTLSGGLLQQLPSFVFVLYFVYTCIPPLQYFILLHTSLSSFNYC